MTPRQTLYLLLPLLLLASSLAAQELDPMTAGRTYVIAFPDTTQNTVDERYPNPIGDTIALFLYSPVATTATINGNGYSNAVQMQAGRFTEVYLDDPNNSAPAPIVTQSNAESRNVFRVESADPIIVYAYICTKYGCTAWTPLPLESWGLEYYAAASKQEIIKDVAEGGNFNYTSKNKAAPAEACVISAYSNTTVTIVPSLRQQQDNLPDWNGFPNLTVTLAADRAYQVQGFIDTLTAHNGNAQPDLAGVYIYADKPIGLVSGNTRAQITADSTNPGLTHNSLKNMMVAAIAPVEQHGREFVFMPTMDDRVLTGQPGEVTAEKRAGESIRIYGTSLGTGTGYERSSADSTRFTVQNASTYDVRTSLPEARYYRADTPMQAFKSPFSVVKDLKAINGNGSYITWGGSTVEMVPREQWTTFAPYIAPLHPDSMRHYVNIVTDTASRFKILDESNSLVSGWINIPGTDLCWTYRSVTPGITKYFKSTEASARFHAFAYGLLPGSESYTVGSAGGYKERLALAYSYPLAPRRAVLYTPDSLGITISRECDVMMVEIRALNVPKPVGFREIALAPGSVNTRLVIVDSQADSSVLGQSYAKAVVDALDPTRNATARIVVTDRTGAQHTIPFTYEAKRVDFAPNGSVEFGQVARGASVDTTIIVTNPLATPVSIVGISLASQSTAPFQIIEPTPLPNAENPIILQPGASATVKVRFTSPQQGQNVVDSLRVELGCNTLLSLPLRASSPSSVEWSSSVEGAVSIRPAPANGRTEVVLRLRRAGVIGLRLTNEQGTEVMRNDWKLEAGEAALPFDVSALPAGLYYCRLSIDGATRTLPLAVTR